tara:strand:+ start:1385 stop:2566 length:1182 start_codon:yes stop_codon:yes gene_type:complete
MERVMEEEKKPDSTRDSEVSTSTTNPDKPKKKSSQSNKPKAAKKRPSKSKVAPKRGARSSQTAKFPRHSLEKVLRIPRAILEQNAGQACSEREAAKYVGVGFGGPFQVEVSSALKYGLMERPEAGRVALTERARKILRPQQPEEQLAGIREAVLEAPDLGDVYKHYRGENLPDPQFFRNALIDKFKIPEDKLAEFETVFNETMQYAKLIDEHNGKRRLLDVSKEVTSEESESRIKKLGKDISVKSTDSCFVMMPFANPIGGYFSLIYEPAIAKAGLTAIRADADIFGTGKIIDQIWRGINNSKVLVAELTDRNPNVFYELGLAHALNKPVVLISSNESDVPFDLTHIRVIYYDQTDPFWGPKLIEKLAENIISAIKNPEEAVFKTALKGGKEG